MSVHEKATTVKPAGDARKDAAANMCEGKVVSMTGGRLVMTNKDGKEQTYTLSKDVKITSDETSCRPEELKAGNRIRVTTKSDDKNVVTCAESLSRNTSFRKCG
jgi:hypothetical protein